MNILVTLTKNYLPYLNAMIKSFLDNHKQKTDVYIISKDITSDDLPQLDQLTFYIIDFEDRYLADVPTSKRYPKSIYYRIFASQVLPKSIERILYLDPDIIIKANLNSFYQMEFQNALFIGSTNTGKFLQKFNEIKNKAPKGAPYINTGVLLMNIKLLRDTQSMQEVYRYIRKYKHRFTLPDQDIISGLYGDRIKLVSSLIYNLSDRGIRYYNAKNPDNKITLDWVDKNTKIIHYYGRNKPWKSSYKGILKFYYDKYKIENEN